MPISAADEGRLGPGPLCVLSGSLKETRCVSRARGEPPLRTGPSRWPIRQSLGIVTGVARPCWVRGTLDCVPGDLVLPGMQFGSREEMVTPSTGPRALAAGTRARGGRPVWAGKVGL